MEELTEIERRRPVQPFGLFGGPCVKYNKCMDTIIRNVRDIAEADRSALEHVLGQPLAENQQIVVRIVDAAPAGKAASDRPSRVEATDSSTTHLDDWCNVLEGMSEKDLADFDATLSQRPVLSRRTD